MLQRAWWTPVRIGIATSAVLLVAAAATGLGLFLWVRSYAPLDTPAGSSPRPARALPVLGGGAAFGLFESHYLVHPGSVTIEVSLGNEGRWAVDVDQVRAVPAAPQQFAVARIVLDARTYDARPLPARGWKIHIAPHGRGADPSFTFRVRCPANQPRDTYSVPLLGLRVHYRYLRFFSRSQNVQLAFPVTLRC
jgi:hypothetical protein